MAARILVVDDHPLIIAAVQGVLTGTGVASAVDQASSLSDARAKLREASYQLVVLDLGLSDSQGMNGLLTLREDFPDIPVIILTSDSSLETVTAAFENNARGFVVKGESPHVLVGAVRTVLAGGTHIPELSGVNLPPTPPSTPLSPRKLDVLRLLLEGLPNKTIAARLGLSENTIKVHVAGIYAELNVHNRVQAVMRARQLGLT
ncbi:MAG TPA: response regulator transcription factor [Burkholderiales bacterium]|nr:response regulator transcription factor [Burkholderiales bacterium]